jgi:hypothetical protein
MARIIGRGKRKSALNKRVNKYKSRTYKGKYAPKRRLNIQAVVKKMMNKTIETKTSTSTITDGVEILHNSFVVLDPTSNF